MWQPSLTAQAGKSLVAAYLGDHQMQASRRQTRYVQVVRRLINNPLPGSPLPKNCPHVFVVVADNR
jgi:hypothetical protein